VRAKLWAPKQHRVTCKRSQIVPPLVLHHYKPCTPCSHEHQADVAASRDSRAHIGWRQSMHHQYATLHLSSAWAKASVRLSGHVVHTIYLCGVGFEGRNRPRQASLVLLWPADQASSGGLRPTSGPQLVVSCLAPR
jgi:hypothetical protein